MPDLAGGWDYFVIVAAEHMAACRVVIDRLFLEAPNIKRYDTLFVLEALKLGLAMPLEVSRRR